MSSLRCLKLDTTVLGPDHRRLTRDHINAFNEVIMQLPLMNIASLTIKGRGIQYIMPVLLEMLPGMRSLKELRLLSGSLDLQHVIQLSSILPVMPSIRHLDLTDSTLKYDGTAMSHLSSALPTTTTLTHLTLNGIDLTLDDIHALVPNLALSNVTHLSMDNMSRPMGVLRISENLSRTNITHLVFRAFQHRDLVFLVARNLIQFRGGSVPNGIGNRSGGDHHHDDMYLLESESNADADPTATTGPKLKSLTIRQSPVCAVHFAPIFDAIAYMPTLRILDVGWPPYDEKHLAKRLVRALIKSHITELTISDAWGGGVGISIVAGCLRYTRIEAFSVVSCGMKDAGVGKVVKAVCRAAAAGGVLRRFRLLEMRRITDAGAMDLVKQLSVPRVRLEELQLSGGDITEEKTGVALARLNAVKPFKKMVVTLRRCGEEKGRTYTQNTIGRLLCVNSKEEEVVVRGSRRISFELFSKKGRMKNGQE
ncbi:hypothetical protein HK102_006517 [Quaeritorhiza haematococci]|nr:hypothetical protein HK102_006517 [Quaeritorhiza haematococci]